MRQMFSKNQLIELIKQNAGASHKVIDITPLFEGITLTDEMQNTYVTIESEEGINLIKEIVENRNNVVLKLIYQDNYFEAELVYNGMKLDSDEGSFDLFFEMSFSWLADNGLLVHNFVNCQIFGGYVDGVFLYEQCSVILNANWGLGIHTTEED